MKSFFNITSPYQFEWGDLAAVSMFINVVLIMTIGFPASWFGLTIAVIGLIHDLVYIRKINSIILRFSTITLNIYFLCLFYK